MAHPTVKLAFLLPFFFVTIQSAMSETIADRLEWAPVFERSYGTPKVVVKSGADAEPQVNFVRPLRVVTVKAADSCAEGQINCALKDYFLNLLWDDYLAESALSVNEVRLNMEELIPMSYPVFIKIGRCQLSGRSSGNAVHDAWWKVRTGMKLTESSDHLLALTTLEWDAEGGFNHGHYAVALRQRGGNCQTDAIYDFRAPWEEDRRPRFTEAPNIHNRLKLKALRENLYDWLYTQTEYRNSHATMRFVKIHEEQVALLRAYNGHVHEAGNFRVFKKNCASLGTQFVNRLLPLDERIKGEQSFADLPLKKNEFTVEHFGGAIEEVVIRNRTQELGREPTSRSELRPAKPSRQASKPYQQLRSVGKIN